MLKLRKTQTPMWGIGCELPLRLTYFSGPYQAAAQGVDPPQHEQQAPLPKLFQLAATFGMLGRFLGGSKIR